MQLLLFRTDIQTRKEAKTLKPVFKRHPIITRWSIDTEDIDKVLRIEASGSLTENEVIRLMQTCGFHCEALPD